MNNIQFIIYNSADKNISVNTAIKDESIWLSQKALADLFGVNKSTISRHLKNIFEENELDEKVVVAKIATITQHGALPNKTQTKDVLYYNLDVKTVARYNKNELSRGVLHKPDRKKS